MGRGKAGGKPAKQKDDKMGQQSRFQSSALTNRARMNDLLRLSLVLVQGYLWESIQMPAEWVTGSAPL